MTTDYEGYLTFLQEFNEIDWVRNQIEMRKKPNFWTILEYGQKSTIKSYEIRLSRMFRWLFDPNANHGLGNTFAHQLFQFHNKVNKMREPATYRYTPGESPDILVTSEEKHIDLLYKDFAQGVIVAIELKHYADEGKRQGISQLEHYEQTLKKLIDKTPLEPYCFYLTPTGKASTRSEIDPEVAKTNSDAIKFRWIPISYSTFIQFIEEVEQSLLKEDSSDYAADVRKLIGDFKDDLQRSVDIITATANKAVINEKLDLHYVKLTQKLAKTITKRENSRHLQALLSLSKDETFQLKELILILDDALIAQNHTPNIGVQMLTRKIYNYFSAEKPIPHAPDKIETYRANEKFAAIKQAVVQKNMPLNKILITKDKGQGLYLYHESLPYRIYMSGDAYGSFPNDGVQLLPFPKEAGKKKKIPKMNGQMFIVEEKLISKNKLKTEDGHIITFNEFIDDYLILSLQNAIEQIKDVMK